MEETVRWYVDNRAWWEKIKTGEYLGYYEKWYGPARLPQGRMKAVFFSDAHLAGDDAAKTERLKGFIKRVTEDADLVVILGDLFEFYHGYEGYIYPHYKEIVDLLRDIASGRSVYLIEGNHEFRMGRYFESYTGIRCVDTLTLNIDDKRVFLSHGDTAPRLARAPALKSRPIYA